MKSVNWTDHLFNFMAVILGVSMAFFVNDRAAKEKEQEEYQQVIDSFIEELSSDKATYAEYQVPDNKAHIKSIDELLEALLSSQTEDLEEKFQSALNFNNYHPSGVTFNSLQSAGKLDLIDDFDLRMSLATYHTVYAEEARIRGEIQVDFYLNQLMPWMLKSLDFTSPELGTINKTELTNLFIVYKGFVENKLAHYEEMVIVIDSLESQFENLNLQ